MSYKHGMYGTSTYKSWENMLKRCENPNCKDYKNYGSRGIKVCDRWHDFRNFFADMDIRPDGLTLDRIDNDGSYEPGNCQWATWEEQENNKRPISCGPRQQHWFRAWYKDKICQFTSNNQNEFARQHGLGQSHINECLRGERKTHKGWTFCYI